MESAEMKVEKYETVADIILQRKHLISEVGVLKACLAQSQREVRREMDSKVYWHRLWQQEAKWREDAEKWGQGLKAALERYGTHNYPCNTMYDKAKKCVCGLDAVLSAKDTPV